MKEQNSGIKRKGEIINPVYLEIFDLLKTGGHEITKSLRKTYGAKPCDEIRAMREELSEVLNSTNPVIPDIQHIRILANAIQNTKKQLNDSKILCHSKGLRQVREDASSLLAEAKNKYHRSGGQPMGK